MFFFLSIRVQCTMYMQWCYHYYLTIDWYLFLSRAECAHKHKNTALIGLFWYVKKVNTFIYINLLNYYNRLSWIESIFLSLWNSSFSPKVFKILHNEVLMCKQISETTVKSQLIGGYLLVNKNMQIHAYLNSMNVVKWIPNMKV